MIVLLAHCYLAIWGHLENMGDDSIKDISYTLNFKGIAGQSFGVWNHSALTLSFSRRRQ